MKKTTVINTSEHGWLDKAVRIRLAFGDVELRDDAGVGVEQEDLEELLQLVRRHQEGASSLFRTLLGVSVGLLLSGMGLWMIQEAATDPEPTSDLWMLLAGGVLMAFFGGLGVFHALGQRWRISAASGDRNMTLGSD